MNGLITTIVAFVVALGVLITVHEFGHFWVARRLGVKVLRFSVGFGKPLWRRAGRDGVEYVIAALPLGGYVRMLDEREGKVAKSELHAAFNRQRLGTRTAVVAAGPAANLLFAMLAYWAVFLVGDTGLRPLVGSVVPDSVAAETGFRAGDEVTAINGRDTPTWERVLFSLIEASVDADTEIRIDVRGDDGAGRRLVAPSDAFAPLAENNGGLDSVGIGQARPVLPAQVGEIMPGEAAARAGMRAGDRILAVDGASVSDWNDWVRIVRASPGQTLRVEVSRDGSPMELELVPEPRVTAEGEIGRIGAAAVVPDGYLDGFEAKIRLGPLEAVPAAIGKTWDMSLLTLRVVWGMVTGRMSVNNLGGPITIAQSAGRSAEVGGVFFLKFLAILSISIGILNLLPIPVLDGGHLFYYLIEAVRGKPLSEAAQVVGQKIGLLVLALLMSLALYVDLNRLLVQ
jgi:regulator of sigma E protease